MCQASGRLCPQPLFTHPGSAASGILCDNNTHSDSLFMYQAIGVEYELLCYLAKLACGLPVVLHLLTEFFVLIFFPLIV